MTPGVQGSGTGGTCDDVLDGPVLALVHVPVVLDLAAPQLRDQLLLLPLALVGRGLGTAQGAQDAALALLGFLQSLTHPHTPSSCHCPHSQGNSPVLAAPAPWRSQGRMKFSSWKYGKATIWKRQQYRKDFPPV